MIRISNNCKKIYLEVPVNNYSGGAALSVSDSTGVLISQSVTIPSASATFTINFDVESKGVVSYTLSNGNATISQAATVATCVADCCMASLLEQSIACTCKCAKCDEDLVTANKIFLLLQAAKYHAEVEFNLTDAEAEYAKAVGLCDNDCGC